MSNRKSENISIKSIPSIKGPQGQIFFPVINKDTVGSEQLSAGVVVMPPGAISHAHLHDVHEQVVVILEGWAVSLVGQELEPVVSGPGDFLFMPPGLVHMAANLSLEDPVVGIELRTVSDFTGDTVLNPDLDKRALEIIEEMRVTFADGSLLQKLQRNKSDNPLRDIATG